MAAEQAGGSDTQMSAPEMAPLAAPPAQVPHEPAAEQPMAFGSGEFGPTDQNLFTEAEDDVPDAREAFSSELRNAFLDDLEEEPALETENTVSETEVSMEFGDEANPETADLDAAAEDDVRPEPDMPDEPQADHFQSLVPELERGVEMQSAVDPRPSAPPSARAADPLILEPSDAAARQRQPFATPQASETFDAGAASEGARRQSDMPVEVPAPAAGRGSRRAGRVKTRLLGFNSAQNGPGDPFAPAATRHALNEPANAFAPETEGALPQPSFPVGWLVVVAGPGRGSAFSLHAGVAQIGRGQGQAVRLDFGDNSISRENHAAIAYDPEQRRFFLGHGGKANLVRLNDRPVLSTEELQSGHLIRLGETTLRFIGLCGADFDWDHAQDGEQRHASVG
ncbi:FHA domain-containing protein [Seohaeicola saemankumensis]|nr:FHA domain-containing protein [Seohaeicola saemankumensis]MCA0869795.1 FHA domain-containing protein [Seohaeicola saemankumensis]